MTMDEYVRWLENRIAIVGTELEILINARKAIEMARGELDKPKPPQVLPKPQRLTLKQAVAKQDSKYQWQDALAEAIRLIRVALPEHLTSGELIERFYPGRANHTLTKREKDRVYAVLSYLKTRGNITRSELGQWSLVEEVSAALSEGQTNG